MRLKALKHVLILVIAILSLETSAQGKNLQIDTIAVTSASMNKPIKNVVILPEQYFDPESQEEQYPVLYMLNGHGGNYSDYIRNKEDIKEAATDYGFIIVCPDGQNSWYWDSPVMKNSKFETYITAELVPYIDDNYRTMATNKMRGIMGLSMGGHGALWLAMRHSDIFSIAGSMSGGVDFTPFTTNWNIPKLLGDYENNKETWYNHTVLSLVPTLTNKQLKILFDVGADDFFYKVNVSLHDALLKAGIDHDFIVRPGKHNWDYWRNSLDYQFLFFEKGFEENSDI